MCDAFSVHPSVSGRVLWPGWMRRALWGLRGGAVLLAGWVMCRR